MELLYPVYLNMYLCVYDDYNSVVLLGWKEQPAQSRPKHSGNSCRQEKDPRRAAR